MFCKFIYSEELIKRKGFQLFILILDLRDDLHVVLFWGKYMALLNFDKSDDATEVFTVSFSDI